MLAALKPRWLDWLERRIPRAQKTTLNQRKIFIVPSKLAYGMLLLVLLLFILAVNFQNALVYVVCFWLLAMLVVNILHTYRNLSGLTLTFVRTEPCFAGEKAILELELGCAPRQKKYALQLLWAGEDQTETHLIHTQTTRVRLAHSAPRRGRFRFPRIDVQTRYPTGLAVAWSHVDLDAEAVVYPKPIAADNIPLSAPASHDEGQGKWMPQGSSDFGGVRDYQLGDTPRQVHWGKYAQTGQLYTKSFVDYVSDDLWLDWDSLSIPGFEARLSHLCQRVLDCEEERQPYGLKLPGTVIEPALGDAHQTRCLHALALYGVET